MALILLVVIGLTGAAAMRTATSSERAVNNLRLENLSQQHAEMALRYCESEMYKPPASRIAALQSVDRANPGPPASGDWTRAGTWTAAQGGSVEVPGDWWSASVATASKRPRCYVEQVNLPSSGQDAYLVTARGYSPDFEEDSTSGTTLRGGSVWLQSLLLTE